MATPTPSSLSRKISLSALFKSKPSSPLDLSSLPLPPSSTFPSASPENIPTRPRQETTTTTAQPPNAGTENVQPVSPSGRSTLRQHKCSTTGPPTKPKLARDAGPEMPVTFSVFYGALDPTRQDMEHIMFNAKVKSSFLDDLGCPPTSPRKRAGGTGGGGLWGSGSGAGATTTTTYDTEKDVSRVKELIHLSASFTDQIIELWNNRGCVVCRNPVVKVVVHRALCVSIDGYAKLVDGVKMRSVMRGVAKMVSLLDTDIRVQQAIGNVGLGTYVHALAVPVCVPDGKCQDKVKGAIEGFLKEVSKGFPPPPMLTDGGEGVMVVRERKASTPIPELRPAMLRRATETESLRRDKSKRLSVGGEAATGDSLDTGELNDGGEDMLKLRLVAFVGRPVLDPQEAPRPLQMSALVYESEWPENMLSGIKCDDYRAYQRVSAYYEKVILKTARFCCAVCPGRSVPATTLLHRPIATFRRDSTTGCDAEELRQICFSLLRYVRGRWKHPEVMAILGGDGVCQIIEFVVPLCRKNTVCEQAAHIAAKIFVAGQLPADMELLYPDMLPNADFDSLFQQSDEDSQPAEIARKLGEGIIIMGDHPSSSPGKGEDKTSALSSSSSSCNITVGNLRHLLRTSKWANVERFLDKTYTKLKFPPPTSLESGSMIPSSSAAGAYTYNQVEKNVNNRDVFTYTLGRRMPTPAGMVWGGYPISAESRRLVESGMHEMDLISPVITLDMLKIIEKVRKDGRVGG
ncbi:hypothetical protein AJ80_08653 [Polytolypa hystricis UAMH7299]|uniref:Uncharacterized protein n=1 Tax=Polytolypa hystricis (strain UAMH7299) TaxID=1447883 RepID=A0A2B7X4G8_POLH7|nr:hypothetical protein AJ80_08653 [Polytolypa hystricis UAMH7299]